MDLKLEGMVALVTGSSKGIGEEVARGLAREGAIVIVHGRDKAKTEQVANDIICQGGRAHTVIGDLTHEDDVERMIDEAQALVKPIGIVINNAGGSGETEDWTTTQPETRASSCTPRLETAMARMCPHPAVLQRLDVTSRRIGAKPPYVPNSQTPG